MEEYVVALTMYGWSIKNTNTGKELSGLIDDLPTRAFNELISSVNPRDNIICSTKRIKLPFNGQFSKWFRVMTTCVLSTEN